jgi:aryl carrier-like protein
MERSTSGAPAADLRQTIAAIIGAAPGEIAGDDNLVFLGLGSLEMMRLVTRWRREGIAVDFGELAADPTIDAWQKQLDAARSARPAQSQQAAR